MTQNVTPENVHELSASELDLTNEEHRKALEERMERELAESMEVIAGMTKVTRAAYGLSRLAEGMGAASENLAMLYGLEDGYTSSEAWESFKEEQSIAEAEVGHLRERTLVTLRGMVKQATAVLDQIDLLTVNESTN